MVETKKALYKGRDWITTEEWSAAELDVMLDVAGDLKRKFKGHIPHRYLPDQTIFLMFFDKSTRTRNSFEAGTPSQSTCLPLCSRDAGDATEGTVPRRRAGSRTAG